MWSPFGPNSLWTAINSPIKISLFFGPSHYRKAGTNLWIHAEKTDVALCRQQDDCIKVTSLAQSMNSSLLNTQRQWQRMTSFYIIFSCFWKIKICTPSDFYYLISRIIKSASCGTFLDMQITFTFFGLYRLLQTAKPNLHKRQNVFSSTSLWARECSFW